MLSLSLSVAWPTMQAGQERALYKAAQWKREYLTNAISRQKAVVMKATKGHLTADNTYTELA